MLNAWIAEIVDQIVSKEALTFYRNGGMEFAARTITCPRTRSRLELVIAAFQLYCVIVSLKKRLCDA